MKIELELPDDSPWLKTALEDALGFAEHTLKTTMTEAGEFNRGLYAGVRMAIENCESGFADHVAALSRKMSERVTDAQ